MQPATPEVAPESPGLRQRVVTVSKSVAAELWKRKWKLLSIALLYGIGRSCQFLPPAMQPLCEALVGAMRNVP